MKLSVSEQIICELHTMGSINEQTGLNGKEVADLVNNAKAPSRLVELRKSGYVKSSDRSTGAMRFWLTQSGESYAIELKQCTSESEQDQSTDANEFQYPIYKASKATGLVVKFTDLTVGETIRQGFDEGSIVGVKGKVCKYFPAHNDDKTWADWTPPEAETVATTESENPYNPNYEMMGSALIDDVVANNVEAFNRLDDVAEKREIPPPQYNPDDVAFKKGDTVFWYTVDGIKEVFETSTDAIHAAQELVKNRKIFATIHAVASKPHAIIKPVVTTELEYV